MLIHWLKMKKTPGIRPVPEERPGPRPAPWRRDAHDPDQIPALVAELLETFGDAVQPQLPVFRADATAWVSREKIVEVCRWLKEQRSMDMLIDLCGVHTPDRDHLYEVVLHLFSLKTHDRLRLKVGLQDGEEMPTLSGVWSAAGWPEREAYDLVGITFAGHPDLRRILLPDEFVGHPLHKDFPLKG